MLVTRGNFKSVIYKLAMPAMRALDTETTSLSAYKDGQLFSLIIAEEEETYYFNFLAYKEMEEDQILPREWLKEFSLAFKNTASVWFMHNAKFDLSMLAREDLFIAGTIHCTQAIARVEYNVHFKYSLDECAKRIGLKKDDAVEKWISKEKAYEWYTVDGRKQRFKNKDYTKVPFEIIHPYGEQDARVTYQLGMHQIKAIQEKSNSIPSNLNTPTQVMLNERLFTKTCFNIERNGVQIDENYCKKAAEYEAYEMEKAAGEFKRLTGSVLVNSGKSLAPLFKELGEIFPQTEKGNDSFTKNVLDTFKSEPARCVQQFRKSEKRAAYFYSYLYYSDSKGIIHADIKQSGTESGRVSYGNPNFQNVPKRGEDKSPFPVRRAIIPRPGYFLVMLDYDQMEYRMMVDYSKEIELIEKINNGLDVHEACREMMGLDDREKAKTMNFMKLYGGGSQKLATSLGISLEDAKKLTNQYWEKLPNVASFISRVANMAENRGYVVNWLGRICHFPNSKFAYAAPNHLIQGGSADVVKVAMNKIGGYLADKKSRMIIQVHDELVLEVHESESNIINNIKEIMESAYPSKSLPLTCGVDYSTKSWFDKVEWGTGNGQKTGEFIQTKSNSGVKTA